MLKIDFTQERVFGFNPPNLCFLGQEEDFLNLAKAISDLTAFGLSTKIDLSKLDFITNVGEKVNIQLVSKESSNLLAVFKDENSILFELDSRAWERLFKYFVFLSWKKTTYYLNVNENCLSDLYLKQDCNFICSSEF